MADKISDNIAARIFLKEIRSYREVLCFNDKNKSSDFCNSSIKSNNKKENDINKDIELIEQILQAIIDYENNLVNLKQTLITIGKLAGEISYNDLGDKDNHYIRNRYGYIRRNKSKSINKNGIYFEQIYRLKIILTNDQIAMSIPEEEINNLKNHLSNLKQKIAHILMDQSPSIHHQNLVSDIIIDFSAPISDIIDLATKYYHQLILQRINDELDQLENIDFTNKDDRYYFGRVFCIIGELFNEWFEDRMIDESDQVLKVLKNFIKLRDQIIHHHGKVKFGLDDKNQSISEIIIEIKDHLERVIVRNKDCVNFLEFDCSYDDATKFHDVTYRLLTEFTGEKPKQAKSQNKAQSKKKKEAKLETNEKIKSRLNRLISKACIIIESPPTEKNLNKKRETNPDSIEDQLDFLNDQYQQNICKLDTNDRSDYPLIIDIKNKNVIKSFSESLVQSSPNCSEPCNKPIYKFNIKLDLLKEEFNYLISFGKSWSNDEQKISARKYSYIIQCTMAAIGQLVRDIETLKLCKRTTDNSSDCNAGMLPTTIADFNKFSSSVLIKEGKLTSKQLRNQGLAHNILCYDDDNFFETLNILESVHSQFIFYYCLMMKDVLPTSSGLLFIIGFSFFQLDFHDEAICYLEKAVARFKDYPNEDDHRIIIPDDFKTEFENTFKITPLVCQTHFTLMMAYVVVGNKQEAAKISKFLSDQINYDQIVNLNEELQQLLLNLLKIQLMLSEEFGNTEINVALLELMDNLSDKADVKLTLAYKYYGNKNYQKAKELLKQIFQVSTNCTDQFEALRFYVKICFENPNDECQNSEINIFIDRMEKLFKENLSDFKFKYRDGYFKKNISIITFRLRMIINDDLADLFELELQANDIDKIRKLSIEFKDIINKFNYAINDDLEIFELYVKFSCAYHRICLMSLLSNPNVEYLTESQYYFDLAEGTIEKFPGTEFRLKEVFLYLARILSSLHLYFVMKDQSSSNKTKLDYLLTNLSFHEKYNLDTSPITNSLADAYFHLGEEYLIEFNDNDKHDIACLALDCFENAIKYYNLILSNLDGDEIIAYVVYFDMARNLAKFQLAKCCSSISVLKCELKLFVECQIHWNELLKLPLDDSSKISAFKCRESNQRTLLNMTHVLEQILTSYDHDNTLQFEDGYIVKYLKNKFEIEIKCENSITKWFYRGMLSRDELKNQIKEELKNHPNETI